MPEVKSPEEFFDSLAQATQEFEGQATQEPTEPVTPAEPTEPVELEPVVEPTEPVEEPNEPSEPVEPTEPDQPVEQPTTEGPIDDWDAVEPQEPAEPTTDIYKQLANELGVDDLTKEKLEEALKPKEDKPITGIPDDLALIVNVAKSGVDYKEYLALKNADYSSYDNRTLVEHSLKDAMKDAEGNLSQESKEQIADYIDDMSEMDFTIQGNQIRKQLESSREFQLSQIEGSAAQIAQNREAELRSSLDSFNEVSGFKVQPHQKSKLQQEISSGDAVADLIYKPDGSYDYNKIVKLKFIADNFDKMLNYHRQRAATDQKREMINRTSNVDTRVNATPPAPDAPKSKDGLDIFIDWAKGLGQ
jgi:hypothetical protein